MRRTWPGENRESDEFHHERSHRRVDVVLAVLGSGVAEVMGAYRTIVADPPWRQSGGSGFDGRAHDTRVKRDVWSRGHDERGKPKHSAKPESFIDVVEQVSPEPRLEMFSRRARFGWDYWGDESLGTAMLPQPEAAST